MRVRKLRPTPQRSNRGRQRRTAVLLRSESSAVLAQPRTVRGPFNGVDYLHITYGPTSQHAEDLQPRRLTPPPTVAGGDGKSVG